MSARKAYVDGPHGQLHLRLTEPVAGALPLVCLHATAYSSQSFLPLMRALRGRRQLIAIDAPGYGESDAPAEPLDMAGYAGAVAAAIEAVCDEPVAVLGYHTGAYVATELAIAQPASIERLVLIGIPYFQALDLAAWRAKLAAPHRLTESLEQFAERWAYFITDRHSSVSLRRGFANFIDELKAWPEGWRAHEAMFAYDSDRRLPQVAQPVLVLNPVGHLAEPSRVAARLFPDAQILEMPEVDGPVLEAGLGVIGPAIERWLDAAAEPPKVCASR